MELNLVTCQVRSWRETDAESLAFHANNRRVWINLRDRFPHPYSLADAHAFIQAARTGGRETMFAIAVETVAAGGISITLHEDVERVSAESLPHEPQHQPGLREGPCAGWPAMFT